MTNDRPPQKKTEMIEVRVSHEVKRDFLAACRTAGRTASDVVRERIEAFVREQQAPEAVVVPLRRRMLKKRYLAAGGAIAALTVFAALPSAAQVDLTASFRSLDRNGDGVLSAEEFTGKTGGEVKTFTVRKLQQGAPPRDPDAPPVIFVVPKDAGGEVMERLRDVRFNLVGGGAAALAGDKHAEAFAAIDANHDGKIDLPEFIARQKQMLANGFRKLDADNSGGLDMAEYEALLEPLLILPADADPALPMAGKYGSLTSADGLSANFTVMDANRDGKVSLDEYLPK